MEGGACYATDESGDFIKYKGRTYCWTSISEKGQIILSHDMMKANGDMKHMDQVVIYVHGKGGNAREAEHYKSLFTEYDVIGFDYHAKNPWEAKKEFTEFFNRYKKKYDSITLVANSIGAYFAMSSLNNEQVDKAFFISPVVDMEKLIMDMMSWTKVTEVKLREKQEISTDFGETLSWEYLCYVRKYPISWLVPTYILYGEKDNLTSGKTISEFADSIEAELTVMKDGEHWFHTPGQMAFLDDWIRKYIG